MRAPIRLVAVLITLLSLTGCAGTLQIGIERAVTPGPGLEATIEALSAENVRLAEQVAALNAAVTTATRQDTLTPAPLTPSATPASVVAPSATTAPSLASPTPSSATTTPTPAAPTVQPTPSPTGPSPAMARVTVPAANLRSGPGTAYPVAGQARQGDDLALVKRNAAADWLQVRWDDRLVWVAAGLVQTGAKVGDLAVATDIAPPPPTTVAPAVSPTAPAPPICDTVPIRGFGQIWGEHPEVAARLGCPSGYPTAGEVGTNAADQTFEHGLMLWLQEDSQLRRDPVYVLFADGSYQRFPDLGEADPSVVGKIDPGFFAPGPRFSKAYWEGTGAQVGTRLGRATTDQAEGPGAYQQFQNGRMFWNKNLKRIFVLYEYWQQEGPGRPGQLVRSWTSFEDTFGDQ